MPEPKTIVLIHGFWVTPRSWEHWIAHYEGKGYRVLAPAPGARGRGGSAERRPDAARAADAVGDRRAPGVRDHELDSDPILMGHSGQAITQILLDRGHGAAGRRQPGADRGGPHRRCSSGCTSAGAEEPSSSMGLQCAHHRRWLRPPATSSRTNRRWRPASWRGSRSA